VSFDFLILQLEVFIHIRGALLCKFVENSIEIEKFKAPKKQMVENNSAMLHVGIFELRYSY